MRSYFALLNLIEFTLWCGIPLSLLAAADLWRSLRNWRVWDEGLGLSLSLLFILLVLGMVGKTAAESGRLWLFLVPLVLFSAARHFSPHLRQAGRVGQPWSWLCRNLSRLWFSRPARISCSEPRRRLRLFLTSA